MTSGKKIVKFSKNSFLSSVGWPQEKMRQKCTYNNREYIIYNTYIYIELIIILILSTNANN